MKVDTKSEYWPQLKDKLREFYHLVKSPDWTLEAQRKLNDEISALHDKVIK